MAHYAKDCWDAEIFIGTHEWVECVGHADRSAYDLEVSDGCVTGLCGLDKGIECLIEYYLSCNMLIVP